MTTPGKYNIVITGVGVDEKGRAVFKLRDASGEEYEWRPSNLAPPPIAVTLDVDLTSAGCSALLADAIVDLIDEMMGLDEGDKSKRPLIVDKLADVFDLVGRHKTAHELREARFDLDRVQQIIEAAEKEPQPTFSPVLPPGLDAFGRPRP
jgi:hypothetical protein